MTETTWLTVAMAFIGLIATGAAGVMLDKLAKLALALRGIEAKTEQAKVAATEAVQVGVANAAVLADQSTVLAGQSVVLGAQDVALGALQAQGDGHQTALQEMASRGQIGLVEIALQATKPAAGSPVQDVQVVNAPTEPVPTTTETP